MLAPILGALAMIAGVLTTWLVNTRPASEQDPDARFWYVFSGASVVAPLVLGATVIDRWTGMAALAMVAGAVVVANAHSSRTFRRRVAAEHESVLAAEHSALAARHESVVRAWSHYELDLEAAISHPSMTDVGDPRTAALAQALASAEHLRHRLPDREPDTSRADYQHAVIALEAAFLRAEQTETPVPAGGETLPAGPPRTSPQPRARTA